MADKSALCTDFPKWKKQNTQWFPCVAAFGWTPSREGKTPQNNLSSSTYGFHARKVACEG